MSRKNLKPLANAIPYFSPITAPLLLCKQQNIGRILLSVDHFRVLKIKTVKTDSGPYVGMGKYHKMQLLNATATIAAFTVVDVTLQVIPIESFSLHAS